MGRPKFFDAEYFERNLAITKYLIPNGATFWFQGAICLLGKKREDWDFLIPEAALGLSNAVLN